MGNDEYEVSGHIAVPFNKKTEQLFYRSRTRTSYRLLKNGNVIENNTSISIETVNKHLYTCGYEIQKYKQPRKKPRGIVNNIHIGITKLNEKNKTIELLITVHAKDMRSLIERCDSLKVFVESETHIKLDEHVDTWTKQELC